MEPRPERREVRLVTVHAPATGSPSTSPRGPDRPARLGDRGVRGTRSGCDLGPGRHLGRRGGARSRSSRSCVRVPQCPRSPRSSPRSRPDSRLGWRPKPLADAEIAFDDAGSPWYTICEVRHPDRPGLLAQIAAGLALAGASVHSVDLETVDGIAVDRFALTDREGNKLQRPSKDAIRAMIREGGRARRRARSSRRTSLTDGV